LDKRTQKMKAKIGLNRSLVQVKLEQQVNQYQQVSSNES